VFKDRYGLDLSAGSSAVRDAYVAAVDCIFAATLGAEEHLGRAIAAEPEFALAHVALARAHFILAKVPEARAATARARELAARATPREQGHVNAIALAIEGKPVEALAATREHIAAYPRDAMVLAPATGVFGLIGFSGRQEREIEQYELLREVAPAYGSDWWFDYSFAFAACEYGRLDEARKLIDHGLAEVVDGEVVLIDRTMGAIVARTGDPVLYLRVILRMFDATRESIDNLARDLVRALEQLYTARFGPKHVPRPEDMAELSRIVLDYRDLGNRVVANRLNEAVREQMVTAVSEFTAEILLNGIGEPKAE